MIGTLIMSLILHTWLFFGFNLISFYLAFLHTLHTWIKPLIEYLCCVVCIVPVLFLLYTGNNVHWWWDLLMLLADFKKRNSEQERMWRIKLSQIYTTWTEHYYNYNHKHQQKVSCKFAIKTCVSILQLHEKVHFLKHHHHITIACVKCIIHWNTRTS